MVNSLAGRVSREWETQVEIPARAPVGEEVGAQQAELDVAGCGGGVSGCGGGVGGCGGGVGGCGGAGGIGAWGRHFFLIFFF